MGGLIWRGRRIGTGLLVDSVIGALVPAPPARNPKSIVVQASPMRQRKIEAYPSWGGGVGSSSEALRGEAGIGRVYL